MTDRNFTRRELFPLAGGLGLGTWLAAAGCTTTAPRNEPERPESSRVPRRPFGNTGVEVSALALGGYVDAQAQPWLLDFAYSLGITYWETTLHRGGRAYGAYFRRNPAHRAEIFLLAKTRARDVSGMQRDLASALAETGGPHLDFFVVQGVDDIAFLDGEVLRFAEAAKREGRIRYFGIATHKNMVACLSGVASLGWIDGALAAYNYRLMQHADMQDALEECAERGIAVTAIKSQALETNPEASLGEDTPAARQLLAQLRISGLDEHEARLMAVWSNPNIASICSMMNDEAKLLANARAAVRWDQLRVADLHALGGLARATANRYCAGCASFCEPSVEPGVPIADVLRYLMYARGYADLDRARAKFAHLSPETRRALARQDYSLAEARCPHGLPIGSLMRRAAEELA